MKLTDLITVPEVEEKLLFGVGLAFFNTRDEAYSYRDAYIIREAIDIGLQKQLSLHDIAELITKHYTLEDKELPL